MPAAVAVMLSTRPGLCCGVPIWISAVVEVADLAKTGSQGDRSPHYQARGWIVGHKLVGAKSRLEVGTLEVAGRQNVGGGRQHDAATADVCLALIVDAGRALRRIGDCRDVLDIHAPGRRIQVDPAVLRDRYDALRIGQVVLVGIGQADGLRHDVDRRGRRADRTGSKQIDGAARYDL